MVETGVKLEDAVFVGEEVMRNTKVRVRCEEDVWRRG